MTTGPAVRLFGAFTSRCGDRSVSAGPAKQCGVLAVLALTVGRPVTTSRLIDSVWGDDPPLTMNDHAERILNCAGRHGRRTVG